MPELINPNTSNSFRYDKWMSLLMDWTSNERLLQVAFSNGVPPRNMMHLAAMIQSTREKRPMVCECDPPAHHVKGPISEKQLAMGLLLFVHERITRRAVADYVQHTYDTAHGDVMKDLLDLKGECQGLVDKGERLLESGLVVVD